MFMDQYLSVFRQKASCTLLTALSNSNWKQRVEPSFGSGFPLAFKQLSLVQLKVALAVSHTSDALCKTVHLALT